MKGIKEILGMYLEAERHDAVLSLVFAELDEFEAWGTEYSGMLERCPEWAETSRKLTDLRIRLNAERERYERGARQAVLAVNAISDQRLNEILRRRYITGEIWEHIADEMGYSCAYVQRLHKDALSILEKAMNRQQRRPSGRR